MPDLPHADAAAACCCRCRLPGARLAPLQDVRVWMEGIIERSKERAGVHSHLVTDAVPADPNQIQLPKFVGHRWAGWGGAGWGGVGWVGECRSLSAGSLVLQWGLGAVTSPTAR